MTAEQLHDAIGLLPADLVAEADSLRQSRPPRRRSYWKRYAAMAACFALVLGCALTVRLGMTGKMSRSGAVMEAAPAEIPALRTPEAETDSSAVTAAGTARDTDNKQRMDSADATALLETAAASETPEILCVLAPEISSTKCYISGPKTTLVSSREELEAYRTKWEGAYLLDELTAACESFDDAWFGARDLVLIPVDAASVAVTGILSQEGSLEVHLAVTHSDADTSWLVLVEPEKGTVSRAEDVRLVFTENGE